MSGVVCASCGGCSIQGGGLERDFAPAGNMMAPDLSTPGSRAWDYIPEAKVPFATQRQGRPMKVSFLRAQRPMEVLDPRMPFGQGEGVAVLPAGMVRPAGFTEQDFGSTAFQDKFGQGQTGIDAFRSTSQDGAFNATINNLADPSGAGANTKSGGAPQSNQPGFAQTREGSQIIQSGIAAGSRLLDGIFQTVNAGEQRAADQRTRDLAMQMQDTQLRIQAEMQQGNRDAALRLQEMQMAHQRQLAELAATGGNVQLQQQLQQAQQMLAMQQQQIATMGQGGMGAQPFNAGLPPGQQPGQVPTWVYIAGAVALVGVGGAVIWAVSSKGGDGEDDDATAGEGDVRAELAKRRAEIKSRIEMMRSKRRR